MQGRSLLSRALTLASVVTLLAAGAARADTLTVNGFGENGGACAAGICPSIRSALTQAAALPGTDTIELPAGDYFLASALNVSSNVTIHGASARTTIVHGSGADRVFAIPAGVGATISHLTMRDGAATPSNNYFGGNLTSAGNLTLDHVRVTNGSGYSAGGIANRAGTMLIANSLIDSNSALNGGGDAGAILNFGEGGKGATLLVRDTTIAFNSARLIGGISEYGDPADSTTLTRVTVAYNSSGDRGGAAIQSANPISVSDSIVAANFSQSGGPNCANVADDGGNLESGTECGFDVQSDGALVSDALEDRGGETNVMVPGSSTAWIDFAGACFGTDQRDVARPQGEACDSGAFELESGAGIDSGPPDLTNRRDVQFSFSNRTQADGTFECRLDTPGDQGAYSECTSPKLYEGLGDGEYRFLVRVVNDQLTPIGAAAARNFAVDTVAPAAPVITGASGVLTGTAEPDALIEIFDGVTSVGTTTANGDGTWSFPIPAGAHTYTVRATDAAGNVSQPSAPRVIAGVTQTPTPTPTATPSPTPVPQKDAVGVPSGTVLIKQGGKFVPLDPAKPIPSGSEIDVTHGRITLTAVLKRGGKPETATFYDGIFKLTLGKTTTDLTLNQPLAKCSKKAIAAAKKPKTRKLWGSGSGSFRTRGQYSAATVRGTEWLVQDSCSGTLTYVKKGVVSVFDQVKKKTIVLRAGKRYTAKPKRR
jgi:hypothetical protein